MDLITLTSPETVPILSRHSVCDSVILSGSETGASLCWRRAERTMWLAIVGSPILLAHVVLAASAEVRIAKGCYRELMDCLAMAGLNPSVCPLGCPGSRYNPVV